MCAYVVLSGSGPERPFIPQHQEAGSPQLLDTLRLSGLEALHTCVRMSQVAVEDSQRERVH